jgi:hypothetical protein
MSDNSIAPDAFAKPSVRPSKTPEELADLVSALSNQQKAEITYELVLIAAVAAEETGHFGLNEFLAELEERAEVYTDPARRRELQQAIIDDQRGEPPSAG